MFSRIRVDAGTGGVLIVVLVGLAVAAIITGIIEFIGKHVGDAESNKKIISIIDTIIWLGMIVIICLDIFNVFPIIRTVLFAILG